MSGSVSGVDSKAISRPIEASERRVLRPDLIDRRCKLHVIHASWLAGIMVSVIATLAVSAQTDVKTIMQRSVEAEKADWSAAPRYSYNETDRENASSKTYEIRMIGGSPYEYLIAIDGSPLPPDQQKREQKKLDQVISERKSQSEEQTDKRIEEYNKERQRDHSILLELMEAFDFTLIGDEKLNKREVYLINATPRKGYQPRNAEDKVLTGMQGRLWIDKETFQWVKVTATVIHPVSIVGFVARVEPGTYFELEKTAVNNGVWLPTHFSMMSHAKIMGFWKHRRQENDTFSNYHQEGGAQKVTSSVR